MKIHSFRVKFHSLKGWHKGPVPKEWKPLFEKSEIFSLSKEWFLTLSKTENPLSKEWKQNDSHSKRVIIHSFIITQIEWIISLSLGVNYISLFEWAITISIHFCQGSNIAAILMVTHTRRQVIVPLVLIGMAGYYLAWILVAAFLLQLYLTCIPVLNVHTAKAAYASH